LGRPTVILIAYTYPDRLHRLYSIGPYEHDHITEFEEAIIVLMEELGHTIQLTERIETADPPDEIYDTYGIYFGRIAPKICVGYTRWNLFLTI